MAVVDSSVLAVSADDDDEEDHHDMVLWCNETDVLLAGGRNELRVNRPEWQTEDGARLFGGRGGKSGDVRYVPARSTAQLLQQLC